MFYSYGISVKGADHIREETVCQDANKIVKCSEGMVLAAVADGLGSEKYSDRASMKAVETATTYCAGHIKEDDTEEAILDGIRQAFIQSRTEIESMARDQGNEIDQYDTTLTLAVLIGDCLYYGHCGDSGIIALERTGLYSRVTEQQRDDYGRVFPLCFEDHWTISRYSEPVGSVLLATDGMLDTFFPVWIRNESVNIHVSQARFFMDPERLRIEKMNEEETTERMRNILESIDPETVGDDKTVAVVINMDIICEKQPDNYYKEPDWTELKRRFNEEWRKAAYPGLYPPKTDK